MSKPKKNEVGEVEFELADLADQEQLDRIQSDTDYSGFPVEFSSSLTGKFTKGH